MISIGIKLGTSLSFLDNKKLFNRLLYFKSAIYSGFISRRFKCFGKDSLLFYKPRLLVGEKYVIIGSGVRISQNIQLTAWASKSMKEPSIVIGNNSNIGESAHITASNGIIIGDNFLCGKNVLITDNSHGNVSLIDLRTPPSKRVIHSKGLVIIKDNVWVGDKVSILPNVVIGEGAIIAANSVVTKDIPPYCVAAGIPAKVIKHLSK